MVWTIKRTDTFPETFAQARFDKKVIHEHVFSFLVPYRHDVCGGILLVNNAPMPDPENENTIRHIPFP